MSSAATCSSPTQQVSPPLLPLSLPLTAVPFDVLIVICLFSDPLQGTYYSRRLSMLRERTEAGRRSVYVCEDQNKKALYSTSSQPTASSAIRLTCRLLYDAQKEATAEARRQYDAMRKQLMYPYWRQVVEDNTYSGGNILHGRQAWVNPCVDGAVFGDVTLADMSGFRQDMELRRDVRWMPLGIRESQERANCPCKIPYLLETGTAPLTTQNHDRDNLPECNSREHFLLNSLRLTLPPWVHRQQHYWEGHQPSLEYLFAEVFRPSVHGRSKTVFQTDFLLNEIEAVVGAYHLPEDAAAMTGDCLNGGGLSTELEQRSRLLVEKLLDVWVVSRKWEADSGRLFTPRYAARTVVELLLLHNRQAFWTALGSSRERDDRTDDSELSIYLKPRSDIIFNLLLVPAHLLLIFTEHPELCPTQVELQATFPLANGIAHDRKLHDAHFSSKASREVLMRFLRVIQKIVIEDWMNEEVPLVEERVDKKLASVGQVAAHLLQFFVENYFVELVRRGEPAPVQQLLTLLLEYGQCHGAEEAKTGDQNDSRKDTGSWIRATKKNCVHCKTIRVVYGCIVESGHYNHREEPGTLSHALKRCGSHRLVGALITFALRVFISSPELRPYVELPLWEQYLSPFYQLLQDQEQQEEHCEPSGPSCSSSGSFRTGRQLKRERGVLKRIPNELLEEARARAMCMKTAANSPIALASNDPPLFVLVTNPSPLEHLLQYLEGPSAIRLSFTCQLLHRVIGGSECVIELISERLLSYPLTPRLSSLESIAYVDRCLQRSSSQLRYPSSPECQQRASVVLRKMCPRKVSLSPGAGRFEPAYVFVSEGETQEQPAMKSEARFLFCRTVNDAPWSALRSLFLVLPPTLDEIPDYTLGSEIFTRSYRRPVLASVVLIGRVSRIGHGFLCSHHEGKFIDELRMHGLVGVKSVGDDFLFGLHTNCLTLPSLEPGATAGRGFLAQCSLTSGSRVKVWRRWYGGDALENREELEQRNFGSALKALDCVGPDSFFSTPSPVLGELMLDALCGKLQHFGPCFFGCSCRLHQRSPAERGGGESPTINFGRALISFLEAVWKQQGFMLLPRQQDGFAVCTPISNKVPLSLLVQALEPTVDGASSGSLHRSAGEGGTSTICPFAMSPVESLELPLFLPQHATTIGLPDYFGCGFELSKFDAECLVDATTTTAEGENECKTQPLRVAVGSIGVGFLASCLRLVTVVNLKVLSPSLHEIPDRFMLGCSRLKTLTLTGFGRGVKRIGDCFLMNCLTLQEVECSEFTDVEEIGCFFLAGCLSLRQVNLSGFRQSLRCIGEHFMAGSWFGFPAVDREDAGAAADDDVRTTLDLSPLHHLQSIPVGFLRFVHLHPTLASIEFGCMPSVTDIGASFLEQATNLGSVDLSNWSALRTIGASFIARGSGLSAVQFSPHCQLQRIGTHFLAGVNNYQCTRSISVPSGKEGWPVLQTFDMDWGALEQLRRIPSWFLSHSAPSTVEVTRLCAVEEVGENFLRCYPSALDSTRLTIIEGVNDAPRTTAAEKGSESWRVDLSSEFFSVFHRLEGIPDYFLASRPVRLPFAIASTPWERHSGKSLCAVARQQAESGDGVVVDLSSLSQVERIGQGFLSNVVGLRLVDVSGMKALKSIGEEFLGFCPHLIGCNLNTLLPPAGGQLQTIEDCCLFECPSFRMETLSVSSLAGPNPASTTGSGDSADAFGTLQSSARVGISFNECDELRTLFESGGDLEEDPKWCDFVIPMLFPVLDAAWKHEARPQPLAEYELEEGNCDRDSDSDRGDDESEHPSLDEATVDGEEEEREFLALLATHRYLSVELFEIGRSHQNRVASLNLSKCLGLRTRRFVEESPRGERHGEEFSTVMETDADLVLEWSQTLAALLNLYDEERDRSWTTAPDLHSLQSWRQELVVDKTDREWTRALKAKDIL